ncbi:unnamed protein product [Effrenium voratum]|uniref:Uncharacterized protein n=1 Tax=Effrenium voratum TaxID=2562239 RepID=A0AA36J354_9DINO|nr:unnamed protein product [Effrenium voratum]CAJ1429844.1 unnamed protein product [Effrenium voratum]
MPFMGKVLGHESTRSLMLIEDSAAMIARANEVPLERIGTSVELDYTVAFLKDSLVAGLDERLDLDQVKRARNKLLQALRGFPTIIGGAGEELKGIIIYKGRPLSGQLLHFAVWISARLRDSSCVERLLPYLSEKELFATAKYQLRSGSADEAWLDAIHIAAGLGALPVMEVLLQRVTKVTSKTQQEYINTPCLIRHRSTNDPPWSEEYYTPLHDATNAGNNEVSMWLLDHKADATAMNKDGVTSLHFVALRGVTGGLESDEEVARLVRALCSGGASLETRIPDSHPDMLMCGKIPMQLAAAEQSRFPKHMMHVLAPCLNQTGHHARFFKDVSFLASLNAEAAEEVVHELVRQASKKPELLHSFRWDAQQTGRTDKMAGILFIAPQAAAEMLEMLMVEPEVQDVAKHNLPTRTRFWRFFGNVPMRCAYRPDVVLRDGVSFPCWKFDSQKDISQQPNIWWHQDFTPEVSNHNSSSHVIIRTMLVPNMLDIDIVMALAQVQNEDLPVFEKHSVQGIVYCLWGNLIEWVWALNVLFQIVELMAILQWGLSEETYLAAGRSWVAVCWIILAAGSFRELFQLLIMLVNWLKKFQGHTDRLMRNMWRGSWTIVSWALPSLLLAAVQLVFALGAKTNGKPGQQWNEQELIMMVVCVLLKSWTIIFMIRLNASGANIHAVSASLLGGATRQMMAITGMIFASFCLAFLILARGKSRGWILSSAYRGLLFGDGTGLDNLGLDIHEDSFLSNDYMLMTVNLISSAFIHIIILNLMIAVFSSEYDRVQSQTGLKFLHTRSKYCAMYYLSCHVFGWYGGCFRLLLGLLALAGSVLALTGMELNHSALVLALSQSLLNSSMVQCHWLSMEGLASDKLDHFLWICHAVHDMALSVTGENSIEEQLGEIRSQLEARCTGMERKMQEVDAKLEHILAKLSGKQEVDSLDSANGDSRSHPVQHVNSISSLSPVQHVNGGGKHIVMGTDKGLATTTTLAPLQD